MRPLSIAQLFPTGAAQPAGTNSLSSAGGSAQSSNSASDSVSAIWSTVVSIWDEFLHHVPMLIGGLIIIILTAIAAYITRRLVLRFLQRWNLRSSLIQLLQQVAFVIVWILGLLLAAMVVFPGITPARALGGLGLLSIAIGFAFKDIFENFFAGVLLLWRFPFEPDDYIECENIIGRVEQITIRMTTIRRPTDELTVVPNSFLLKNPVHVLTDKSRRRISIMAGVAYDVNVPEAVRVIESAVRDCDTVSGDKPIQIFPKGFGSSSIDIEVAWWADPTPLGERRSRGEVVTAIKLALDDHGLEIPFPYRTLTFKEPLQVTQSDAKGKESGKDTSLQ